MKIYDRLKKDINILNNDLKSEDEIISILKVRFTKKEYKYYMMRLDGFELDQICKKLNITNDRLEQISKTVIKKLNSNKLKLELFKR